jgi:hypothetical protein
MTEGSGSEGDETMNQLTRAMRWGGLALIYGAGLSLTLGVLPASAQTRSLNPWHDELKAAEPAVRQVVFSNVLLQDYGIPCIPAGDQFLGQNLVTGHAWWRLDCTRTGYLLRVTPDRIGSVTAWDCVQSDAVLAACFGDFSAWKRLEATSRRTM